MCIRGPGHARQQGRSPESWLLLSACPIALPPWPAPHRLVHLLGLQQAIIGPWRMEGQGGLPQGPAEVETLVGKGTLHHGEGQG